MAERRSFITREIPLSGRLVTADDPAELGPNDFSVMKNMRYGNKHPRTVGGCTKYNTTALASTGIRSGIHYRKGNGESHVVVGTSDGKIWRNGTAIGSQGNFDAALWDTAGAYTPRFAVAPQGALSICDGVNTLVYGGTEFRCAGFVDYPETGKIYDYSEEVANSLTATDQLATVHSATFAIDAATMLLLHYDNNVTDSSPTTAHTVTNVTSKVTFSTTAKKFGTHGAVFNGTDAYLTIPDNADFDLSDGTWSIDFWVKPGAYDDGQVLYHHGTDADNYMQITLEATGFYIGVKLVVVAAASTVVEVSTSLELRLNVWSHVAVVENGDSYKIYINGTLWGQATDTDRPANYTGTVKIGADDTPDNFFTGTLDEYRVSNSARWTGDFTPPSAAYGTQYASTTYIGSILPLAGFKAYVETANTEASTMSVDEWTGGEWSALSVTDNTADGGISLAQTGTVTWATTADTSKPKIVEKVLLYWYRVTILSSTSFSAVLSQVTTIVPIQQLRDLWDGTPFPLTAFMGVRSGVFYDYTTNVAEDVIDSANTYTWAGIGQYTSSDYLILGSPLQLMGVIINFADTAVNTNAMIASVSYWDGDSWVVAPIDDTTVDSGKSFAKSGMITWTPPAANAEHRQTAYASHTNYESAANPSGTNVNQYSETQMERYQIGIERAKAKLPAESRRSTYPAYYYKITFSATLSGSDANGVKAYYAAGILAPQPINGYSFSIEHQESLWLFDNYDGKRNLYMGSAPNTVNVFNGQDAFQGELGKDDRIVSAASLFTRYGSAIADMLVMTKANETWVLIGANSSEYIQKRVNASIGCIAPLSMVSIPIGDEAVKGVPRNICIWVATQGVALFDGNTVSIISDDIEDLFDPLHANYIGAAALAASSAFYDPVYNAYVLCIGGSTTWRFDLKRKKWHEVPMSSGKRLYGGFPAIDSNGIACAYGFGNTGYAWKLDSGTTFDSEAVASTLRIAAQAPIDNKVSSESMLRKVKLVQKAKASGGDVTITHYGDSSETGTAIGTASPIASGQRLVSTMSDGCRLKHDTHEIELTQPTIGFEPVFLIEYYDPEPRQDVR